MTHFVYLIRGRKVGATRDRLRDRLREQGHDLPHRITDDGRVLPGDPDVEVLAVYTGQSPGSLMRGSATPSGRSPCLSAVEGDALRRSRGDERAGAPGRSGGQRSPGEMSALRAMGRQPRERGEVARTWEVRAAEAPSGGGGAAAGIGDGKFDPVASIGHLAYPQRKLAPFRELAGA